MKRGRAILFMLVLMLCTACSVQEDNNGKDSGASDNPLILEDVSTDGAEEMLGTVSEDDIKMDLLSEAIREAIVEANKGSYLPGECQGVGYKIMETFEEDGVLSVYALTEYIEYGFQDNVFVNISGTNPKVLMRFRITENNNYDLIFYTRLDLLSDLSEEELEELMQPLAETGKDYLYSEQDMREVRAQADEEAAEYLRSINRTDCVGNRQDHEGRLLEEIVSDESLLQELFKDEELSDYPNWLGTSERVENEERYIYKTSFDEEKQEITYTKIEYDTGAIIESIVVDVQSRTIMQ